MHTCGSVAIIMVLHLAALRVAGTPLLTEKQTLKLKASFFSRSRRPVCDYALW